MASDEASEESEFLWALNASLESFVHKTLRYEQIDCFHILFRMDSTANAASKTTIVFLLAYKEEWYLYQVTC